MTETLRRMVTADLAFAASTCVVSLTADVLRDWPLFEGPHCIKCHPFTEAGRAGYWLGYAHEGDFRPVPRQLGTGFDLNVIDGVCYLLDIRLEDQHRGKGYGAALYALLIKLAGALGCTEIRQTPSGDTGYGESRAEYLQRRGWQPSGAEVYWRCGWEAMRLAPENATWVEVMLADGSTCRAHWASDLSGEEQPPFRGWFRQWPDRPGFHQVEPAWWRPLPVAQ